MASTTTVRAVPEQTPTAKPAVEQKTETAEEYRRRRAGIACFL